VSSPNPLVLICNGTWTKLRQRPFAPDLLGHRSLGLVAFDEYHNGRTFSDRIRKAWVLTTGRGIYVAG